MTDLYKIEVINDSYIEHNGGYDPDDEWSRDSTTTTNDIRGIKIGSYDLASHFKPIKGEKYYLLYAEYNTGDSFGYDDGVIEYIGLYEPKEQAQKQAELIKIHNDKYEKDHKWTKNESSYSLDIEMPNGQVVKISAPWNGYFESLNFVDVIEVELHD